MPLSCEAVIFDLDGVLVDSRERIRRQWKRWADRQGIPFEEVQRVYHGRPAVEVIREVAPHLDAESEVETVGAEMDAPEGIQAFDGAQALLRSLPDGQWAIATSGRHKTATTRLSHAGLPRPNVLVTADDVERGKPAPDPYQLAADRLGIAPSNCIVVEDAPAGVESARTAGAQVVAVTTGHTRDGLDAAAVVPTLSSLRIRSVNGHLRVAWPAEGEE